MSLCYCKCSFMSNITLTQSFHFLLGRKPHSCMYVRKTCLSLSLKIVIYTIYNHYEEEKLACNFSQRLNPVPLWISKSYRLLSMNQAWNFFLIKQPPVEYHEVSKIYTCNFWIQFNSPSMCSRKNNCNSQFIIQTIGES